MNDVNQAIARLRIGVHHMKVARTLALERAKDGAVAEIAIVAKNPDGSGEIGASLGFDDFFADIQMLIGEVEEPKDKDLALGRFKGLTGL